MRAYDFYSRVEVACSRLSVSEDDWKSGGRRAGSGSEKWEVRSVRVCLPPSPFLSRIPLACWSRLSPARSFNRPHWLRAWNRLGLRSIRKLTRSLHSLVHFLILLNSWIKIVQSIFHGVICLFYRYWDFWKEKLLVNFISLGAHV